jgi:hypothetical protein
LYNVGAGTFAANGTSEQNSLQSVGYVQLRSHITALLTLTSATTYWLLGWVERSVSNPWTLGVPTETDLPEVYTVVEITRHGN